MFMNLVNRIFELLDYRIPVSGGHGTWPIDVEGHSIRPLISNII